MRGSHHFRAYEGTLRRVTWATWMRDKQFDIDLSRARATARTDRPHVNPFTNAYVSSAVSELNQIDHA